MLESMELEGPAWQTPRYHRGQGAALLEASADQGLEGVVAKRLDSRYAPGQRSSAWIKVKNKQRTELVIGGWLPEKERPERLGALLVGYHDEEGTFRYAGRVGTGWDAKERARLERAAEAPLAREQLAVRGKARAAAAPAMSSRAWSPRSSSRSGPTSRMLRHPSYKGLVDMEPQRSCWRTRRIRMRSAVAVRECQAGRGGGPRQRGDDRFARAGAEGGQERGRGGGRGAHAAAVQPRQARCIRRRGSPRAT